MFEISGKWIDRQRISKNMMSWGATKSSANWAMRSMYVTFSLRPSYSKSRTNFEKYFMFFLISKMRQRSNYYKWLLQLEKWKRKNEKKSSICFIFCVYPSKWVLIGDILYSAAGRWYDMMSIIKLEIIVNIYGLWTWFLYLPSISPMVFFLNFTLIRIRYITFRIWIITCSLV